MEKFKDQLTRTVHQLAESFSTEDDIKVMLDDMSDYVISSYNAPSTSEEAENKNFNHQTNTTPRKSKNTKISEEEEVINSIDAAYFIDHDEFDAIDYELKKLCDIEMCYEDIQRERLRLKNQHSVVSKKMSSLIVQKSPSYSSQIGEMESIRTELSNVLANVIKIRRCLAVSRSQCRTSLGIVANEKKKSMLKNLKSILTTLKTFHESQHNIQETIETHHNFPLAIQMLIETQILAESFSHFTCVNEVLANLSEMSSRLEVELKKQLATIAVVYDSEKYNYAFTAYEMLDKIEDLPNDLVESFRETLESTSQAVILDKLEAKSQTIDDNSTFLSLCMKLDNDQAVIGFREMGFVFCRTFYSFHSILRYHSIEETSESSQKIYNSLIAVRHDIFSNAVKRILNLIESRDFVSLKIDQILEIVDMINCFKKIGNVYFGFTTNELVEAIEKRISRYFERYHKERMEELMMFIENESFAVCPVPPQFTIFDLQDFEFLKEAREEMDRKQEEVENQKEAADDVELMGQEWQNPFCQAAIKSRHQSTYSQKSERSISTTSDPPTIIDDAFEVQETSSTPSPNLCNTALNLLRFFGRYIRMTALLPSICNKSIPAIVELYEFFFASMCHIFGRNAWENVERIDRLAKCLERIGKMNEPSSPFRKVFRAKEVEGAHYPTLCPAVQIEFIDNLYGACERIIAIDSIEFVAKQLDLIRPVIESLLSDDVKLMLEQKLEEFYGNTLQCKTDAKKLIIDTSAARSLRLKTVVEKVSSVKWDINELKSQHSEYVDFLIQDFQVFALRLGSIAETSTICVTKTILEFFWDRTIFYAFKALVQGYGDGGKCSTEGRALMQLDFQNILMKLEPLCGMKPVPHANFVDGYIKAYYLPENGLEQWIGSHSEYSAKQLTSLLGAAAHVSKKARMRILEAMKD